MRMPSPALYDSSPDTRFPQALSTHPFSRKHLHSHKVLNLLVVYAMLFSMILGVIEPAHAAPVANAPAAAPASTDVALSIVDVGAPAINHIFDTDGTIIVSDLADHFLPPFSVGDGFLQSRTFPIGEPGTQAAGLYAYLYRVDLRGAIGTTAISCVTNMEIDFGPVATLDYNLDGKFEQVFVVTSGGLGNVTVGAATQTGTVVNFRFSPSVCGGASRYGGDSSFFFGMTSKDPEQVVPAKLTGTAGLNVTLKAKAPRQGTVHTEPGCFEIKHPSEIPAPVLIDFDDLPDAATIGAHYDPAYGVKFHDGADTKVITYADRDANPTKARSKPNVATNNAQFPATSENVPLTFNFDSGKTHVGFYMGNGETAGLPGAMVGYDAAGNVICQITNTPVPETYDEFIGMYDPAGRIMSITLNYGASLLSESIDDFYFAPGKRGVGAAPTAPLFGGDAGVRTEIVKSDNETFSADFYFPPLQLNPVHAPDKHDYLQALLPGVDPNTSSEPGDPDLPIYRTMIAAPEGATVRVAGANIEYGAETQGMLLPAQPSPADNAAAAAALQEDEMPKDEDFMDLPFERNDETYRSSKPWPEQPVSVVYMGMVRDLNLWQVSIAAGQYTPNKGLLLPAVKVSIQLNFEGGKGGFLPSGRQNMPFDGNGDQGASDGVNPLYAAALNNEALLRYPYEFELATPICWGHEYLIITDPAFKAAADTLRTEKVAKGISTLVVETGAGAGKAGTTNTQIRDYIKSKYNGCLVRPSYVLLLGDAEFIPPFYRSTQYGDLAGTDLDYSLMSGADILPDLAYGRIPVDTLEDANRVITKIVDYEQSPPMAPQFYDDATIAAYFQCCRPDVAQDGTDSRSFLETAEMVRNHLLGRGFDVERIYKTDTHYHDNPGEPSSYYDESTRSATPNRYYNGALLPAALRAGSGYAWDGSSADVVDAINDGSFLVIHRDHGGINGWGAPSFGSSNLASLTNGDLTPVVYSVNCASGLWDNETRNPADDAYTYSTNVGGSYWAERILRMEGGAVGVIGDTRNSPTWANSALLRGLIDASWPTLLPYGPATALKRQGDVLNHAKLYMASQVGVAQTAGSVTNSNVSTNIALYHVLGDPTLQMWTKDPWKIILPKWFRFIEFNPLEWKLRYPVENVVITALQGGNPIARGVVVNGIANLHLIGDGSSYDKQLPVDFSAQAEDGQSVKLAESTRMVIAIKGQDAQLGGPDTKFGLLLPAVAFAEDLTIVHVGLEESSKPTPEGTNFLGGFELGAFAGDGSVRTAFSADWTATIDLGLLLPAASAAGDGAAPGYQCMWLDEEANAWTPIASSVAGNTLTCKADHFSEFAVVATEGGTTQSTFLPLIGK